MKKLKRDTKVLLKTLAAVISMVTLLITGVECSLSRKDVLNIADGVIDKLLEEENGDCFPSPPVQNQRYLKH